jgi:hypothetical protein
MRVKAKCSECVSGRRREVLRKGRECSPEWREDKVTEMKADFGIPHSWCIKCRSEQSLTVHYPAPESACWGWVCVRVCTPGGMILSSRSRSQKLELSQRVSMILPISCVSLLTRPDKDDADVSCCNIVMRNRLTKLWDVKSYEMCKKTTLYVS